MLNIDFANQMLIKFQAKTYVEALKSPTAEPKPKRSGWKIQVSPKGDAQMTLEASFDAGRLVREAKLLKRKAHLEQCQVTVSIDFGINWVMNEQIGKFQGRNQFEQQNTVSGDISNYFLGSS